MLARLLSAALAGSLLLLTGSPAFAYYSKDSYEAEVSFTSIVEIAEDTPDYILLPSYINRQLLYLAGPLQAVGPRRPRPKRLPPRTMRRSTFSESIATAGPASSTSATAIPARSSSTTHFRTS